MCPERITVSTLIPLLQRDRWKTSITEAVSEQRQGSSWQAISRDKKKKKKSDHEFTAAALWHWLLTQSPSKKQALWNKNEWLPELVMSPATFVPISEDSCFDQGAGVSLRHCDCDRPSHPPLTHTPHPPNSHALLRPPLHQCQEPCRQEAKRMAATSFPSKSNLGQELLIGVWPLFWWHYVKGNCELTNLVTFIDNLVSKLIRHRK